MTWLSVDCRAKNPIAVIQHITVLSAQVQWLQLHQCSASVFLCWKIAEKLNLDKVSLQQCTPFILTALLCLAIRLVVVCLVHCHWNVFYFISHRRSCIKGNKKRMRLVTWHDVEYGKVAGFWASFAYREILCILSFAAWQVKYGICQHLSWFKQIDRTN